MVDGHKLAAGLVQGDTEIGFMPAGQVSGLIHSLSSAGDVVRAFIEEAEEVLAQLAEAHMKLGAAR
jgi:NAD(P)H-dependent flavin oxidoreductase YrpB (nitropropane dioxygenase family)